MVDNKSGRPPRDIFHNPLSKWARSKGYSYKQAAEELEIPYSTMRMLCANSRGISWNRASQIEKKTRGKLQAANLMEWFRRNKRGREGNNLIPRKQN